VARVRAPRCVRRHQNLPIGDLAKLCGVAIGFSPPIGFATPFRLIKRGVF
jgi:hypothetical protein